MKITKLVHSCMLVEKDGKKALVDPGDFSWNSGAVDQNVLHDIDYVLITHAHADHIDPTFANVVHELSPNAIWYVTASTAEELKMLGAKLEVSSSFDDVRYVQSEHADLTCWGSCKDHTSFVLFGELLIGGDCHTLDSMHGARVLAGAINGGPWGAILGMLRMIRDMDNARPEKFIPLHDWHWHEQARAGFYKRLEGAMGDLGVDFIAVENGQEYEV